MSEMKFKVGDRLKRKDIGDRPFDPINDEIVIRYLHGQGHGYTVLYGDGDENELVESYIEDKFELILPRPTPVSGCEVQHIVWIDSPNRGVQLVIEDGVPKLSLGSAVESKESLISFFQTCLKHLE